MNETLSMLGAPLLACLLILSVVGYAGLHVLRREVVFIDIALAQVAAVGAILPHLFLHAHHDSLLTFACSLACVIATAAFYAWARRRISQIPLEAVIGVSYAIAAGLALFLIGVQPGGHVHIKHMLVGSILWTTWRALGWSAAVFAVVAAAFFLMRGRLRAISEDYDAAVLAGFNVAWWDFLFYASLGLAIVCAVRIAGVVVVFCFLIIPATASALFYSDWRRRLFATWVIGAAASVLGLLFADLFDFSVGPSVALFAGALLIVSALTSGWRRPKTSAAAVAALIAAAEVAALAARPAPPVDRLSEKPLAPAAAPAPQPPPAANPARTPARAGEQIAAQARRASDPATLERLFHAAGDPDTQSRIAARLLAADPRRGAALALEFLSRNPPLFFRQTVVDALASAAPEAKDYDTSRDFAAPGNQAIVKRVRERFHLSAPGAK